MSSLFHRHLYEISQFPIVLDCTCLIQLLEHRCNHYNIFWINNRLYFRLVLMSGCAIFELECHNPLLNPVPSDSVAPNSSNCSGLHLSRNVIGVPITPLQYLANDNSAVKTLAPWLLGSLAPWLLGRIVAYDSMVVKPFLYIKSASTSLAII